jgi:hypothetical protein
MIIPVPDETSTAVTIFFHKRIQDWSEDDQAAIIRRLRQFFKRSCKGKRKPAAVRRPRDAQRDR